MINPLTTHHIDDFEKFISMKGCSPSSVKSYISDLNEAEDFFNENGLAITDADTELIEKYLDGLEVKGKSNATINRRISSLKVFYNYLKELGITETNPASSVKTRKPEEKELVYLSQKEIVSLIEMPDDSVSGIRDRALLEILYATGMKVTELCCLKLEDLDLKFGSVNIQNGFKSRIIPLAEPCKEALKKYLMFSRPKMMKQNIDNDILFVSYMGEQLTRQGVWKIIKTYGDKTEFADKVSARTIRNSFAAHLIQNGADLKSLQELLGHEDIFATKVYLSVSKNRVLDVYNKAFPRK